MGCFCSKTPQCSRCKGRGNDLVLTDSVCHKCIQIQQLGEFRRRLAALRDEGTASSDTANTAPLRSPRSTYTQTLQAAETPKCSVVISQPRYNVRSSKRGKRRNKTSHRYSPNSRPLFGKFKCPECRHTWASRRSWLDMYQVCQECGETVYPHFQREIRKSDLSGSNNPHPEDLCEKCIELGYCCSNYSRKRRM